MTQPTSNQTEKAIISILIPARNASAYVSRIDSIAERMPASVEMIIVEDGSTDSSPVEFDHLASRRDRVRVVHTEGIGVAAARRIAIEASLGNYVWFIDADDHAEIGVIANHLPLVAAGDYDALIFDAAKVIPGQREVDIDDASRAQVSTGNAAVESLLRGELSGHLWNKIFRRDILQPDIIPKLATREDLAACLRAFANCGRVQCISEKLYTYNVHPESAMNSRTFDYDDLIEVQAIAETVATTVPGRQLELLGFIVREVVRPLANEAIRRKGALQAIRSEPFRNALRIARDAESSCPAAPISLRAQLAFLRMCRGLPYAIAYRTYRTLRWATLDLNMRRSA